MFERGEIRPRWKTAERLLRALDLSDDERDEFKRVWSGAGTPKPAQAAASGPAIPGLAVWKYLPDLLFNSVEHHEPELWRYDPDAVLVDVVRGAASLLSWVGTWMAPISETHARELHEAASVAFSKSLDLSDSVPTGDRWGKEGAALDAMSVLPFVRRAQLFSSLSWTESAVGGLAAWDHYGGVPQAAAYYPASLTFAFRSPGMHSRFSFELVPVDLVVSTHDAMVAYRLWSELGLSNELAPAPLERWAERVDLRRSIDFIMKHDPSEFAGAPPQAHGPSRRAVRRDLSAMATWKAGLWHSSCSEFALRLYQLPEVAAAIIGLPREQVEDRCQQIARAGGDARFCDVAAPPKRKRRKAQAAQ